MDTPDTSDSSTFAPIMVTGDIMSRGSVAWGPRGHRDHGVVYGTGTSYGPLVPAIRRPCHPGRGSGDACLVLRDVEVDHAIRPAASAVDDAGPLGVLVVEQVEVVADQLHLVKSLIQPHGHGLVDLLTDLDRRVAFCEKVVLVTLTGRCHCFADRQAITQPRRGLRHGLGHAPPTMDPTPVVVAPEALQQLVHGYVQGAVLVVGACLGPNHRALDMAGDLDAVACFGLALVGLMGHHNIEALNARRELRDL